LSVLACGPEMLKSIIEDVSRFRDKVSKKILRHKPKEIQYETRTLDKI
jgi:hypothetical protein